MWLKWNIYGIFREMRWQESYLFSLVKLDGWIDFNCCLPWLHWPCPRVNVLDLMILKQNKCAWLILQLLSPDAIRIMWKQAYFSSCRTSYQWFRVNISCFLSSLTSVCWFHSGWILIDRSGKHFGNILYYLREGTVILPKGRQGVLELLAEAKYYLIQGLVELCQNSLQVSHFKIDSVWSSEIKKLFSTIGKLFSLEKISLQHLWPPMLKFQLKSPCTVLF